MNTSAATRRLAPESLPASLWFPFTTSAVIAGMMLIVSGENYLALAPTDVFSYDTKTYQEEGSMAVTSQPLAEKTEAQNQQNDGKAH